MSVRIVLVSEHAELREQFSGMLLEAHDLELVDVVTDPTCHPPAVWRPEL